MMKILVVSPSWIGDTVMSNSMYQLLMMRYRFKVQIDVVLLEQCQSVVNYMSEINRILFLPYRHGTVEFMKCFYIGVSLRRQGYQQAIVLPNSFKSALIPFFAGIALRTGWRGEMRYGILNDLRILDSTLFPLMVQRYAALAYNQDDMKDFSYLPSPLPWPRLCIKKKLLKKHYLNLIYTIVENV